MFNFHSTTMSSLGINVLRFFKDSRPVQRTLDASVPPLAPDPGGFGWFNIHTLFSRFPPRTGTSPIAAQAPPTDTLGVGPIGSVLPPLVLIVGIFSLFTTLGPFKRTGDGGFPSLLWVCDLLSHVLPLFSFDLSYFYHFAILTPLRTSVSRGSLALTTIQAAWQSREVQEKLVLTETVVAHLAFGLLCIFWLRTMLINAFPHPRNERRTSAFWVGHWVAGIVLYFGYTGTIGYLQVQWTRQVRPFRRLLGMILWQEDVSWAAYVWVVEILIVDGGSCVIWMFSAVLEALVLAMHSPFCNTSCPKSTDWPRSWLRNM
ncbi:hypothetical protein NEOLEDRAFT_129562 [Neolentinus lepideus HHB14362 ss-1]|uniref:Uncharacterized protein n=1 Tax=Neolentinus lepideus HHB14362 ss-1 TaxID=1314782 RepID=A0A165MPZ0_9AGAM|nr:hypothetical protein NEOLEDRAFT_129562 [Neolentinus lepideus HHB14362 ss-1]